MRRVLIAAGMAACISLSSSAQAAEPKPLCNWGESALWGTGGLVLGLLLFPPAGILFAGVAAGAGKCWYDSR